jgi:hypothetical protein
MGRPSQSLTLAQATALLEAAESAPRPSRPLVDRTLTNPMFNDQKMKLGLFGTNCSYGLTMSHAPSTYVATWDHTLEIARCR